MKTAHWVLHNGSGMFRVAESFAKAESAIGLDSVLIDLSKIETWGAAEDADVHITHTHFPADFAKRCTRPLRVVWVGHGTPDHTMQSAVEEAERANYGHSDGVMLALHWLKTAHAKVTFWERHKWIYDRVLTTGARPTDLIPLGVDREFWSAGKTAGKFAGEPSVLTCENPHYIKWPYDLFTAWPTVCDEFPKASLHAAYVVKDHHRAFFPWFNALGAFYHAYITLGAFAQGGLRNALQSVDFFCGLVRYGDLNHLSLQASAAGTKTISYTGNPHADFWIPEGDQREIAKHLIAILRGDAKPRTPTPVPDIKDTAEAMRRVYEGIV